MLSFAILLYIFTYSTYVYVFPSSPLYINCSLPFSSFFLSMLMFISHFLPFSFFTFSLLPFVFCRPSLLYFVQFPFIFRLPFGFTFFSVCFLSSFPKFPIELFPNFGFPPFVYLPNLPLLSFTSPIFLYLFSPSCSFFLSLQDFSLSLFFSFFLCLSLMIFSLFWPQFHTSILFSLTSLSPSP